MTEADTCREFVTPKLVEAGWGAAESVIGEQHSFTNGRIIVAGGKVRRGKQRRADYLLYYRRDTPLAIVEAKEAGLPAENGVQQAREYAEMLGLKFAYATNGHRIIEIDYTTGTERDVDRYASPEELWLRLTASIHVPEPDTAHLLEPFNLVSGKVPRYYQRIAIQRAIESVLLGQKRILATLATGTGKTCVAFQICWKLWNSRWNRTGEYRRPKILFLADRNILVDDPMAKMFAPFGDARHKIAGGDVSQSRDMYFGIYQALSTSTEDVFRKYRPDFFDLIVIDECHRGSSRDESSWRAVLEYFEPAIQFGMTATPLREESRDSYEYFGNPVYTYSLRRGIEDGFLAPYRVHRVITIVDAAGWRPSKDELDRFGREIPDDEYQTKDFERVVALRARTRAMARHLTDFLKGTDRFAKTLIFCVDQEHAAEMRQELVNLNSDLMKQYPDYVCRVTADEGAIGLTHLSHFQDVDKPAPVILTTSQLLTTGVDAEMVKNVVLARVVGSRSEFKQIVGRGTRLKVDYGKEYFNIIDFTDTATRHFADPDFDGDPALLEEVTVDEAGAVVDTAIVEVPGVAEPKEFRLHTIVRLPQGVFAPYTDIPANLLFFERGGPTDTIWYYELPLPEGRKSYSKTAPLQFEEFAAAQVWWNERRAGTQAWAMDFAAKRAGAVDAATSHWQNAEAERNAALALGKPLRELEQAISVAANGEKSALQDKLRALKAEQQAHEQGAKAAQAEGDALYWPIYNLDIKNPSAKAGLEHADPKDLIAPMRGHEAEVMRLLGEIEALVLDPDVQRAK